MKKQSIVDKWVKSLRSGKYKQTMYTLFDGVGYCCLGVFCNVAKIDFHEFKSEEGNESDSESNDESYINVRNILEPLNIDIDRLMSMNDKGSSFNEIANEIEGMVAK